MGNSLKKRGRAGKNKETALVPLASDDVSKSESFQSLNLDDLQPEASSC